MPESTLEWVRATFDPETESYKDRRQVAEELAPIGKRRTAGSHDDVRRTGLVGRQ